ncbi:MAG: ATP-binding protein [Balneolaceae bacterium]
MNRLLFNTGQGCTLQLFFTMKKETQGTVLGLSITHDIVKAHGGSLDVHTQPGKTIFSILIIH